MLVHVSLSDLHDLTRISSVFSWFSSEMCSPRHIVYTQMYAIVDEERNKDDCNEHQSRLFLLQQLRKKKFVEALSITKHDVVYREPIDILKSVALSLSSALAVNLNFLSIIYNITEKGSVHFLDENTGEENS